MSFYSIPLWLTILTVSPTIIFAQDTAITSKHSDWSRIQSLSVGTKIRVRLLKKESSKKRTIKGFFSSNTDNSITISFKNGTAQTIEKSSVSTVRSRRRFKERYTGFIIGIPVAIITAYLYNGRKAHDITPIFRLIFPAMYTVPATIAGFHMMPTRLIYRTPRDS